MKTYCLYSNESLESEFLAASLQGKVHAETTVLEQVAETGVWKWSINSSLEDRFMMEHHQSMIRYHKGSRLFWFDGGTNGDVQNRFFVGYGDGVTKDFNLPFRHIYKQSLIMSVNRAIVTAWTLSGKVISFTSAPAAASHIEIEKCKLRFKAFIVTEDEKVYKAIDNYKSYATQGLTIQEYADS